MQWPVGKHDEHDGVDLVGHLQRGPGLHVGHVLGYLLAVGHRAVDPAVKHERWRHLTGRHRDGRDR
ncbi:hypothetical protein ACF3NS_01645 [Arsenicicoccus cauae]|uniref:Uncharacterized protein n=1 Tax=Arsenicicoccus cauae TaxID=2663847 RepID=A0A6I3ISV7_9MICO|nr:hypothetical protein [Arsenicicoccus cauae]MTB71351.1 hypothetical protein [Arsenicicoccus cauae]